MQNEADAKRVSEFFLSEQAFDDQHHTPGEIVHFSQWPSDSLQIPNHRHWYENESGEIIGVISTRENEHRTGGYLWDYMVVHKKYRRVGVACMRLWSNS